MPRHTSLLATLALALAACPAAPARPVYKKHLADHYGPGLPAKLAACTTCHLPGKAGEAEGERPHNPFGLRLKALLEARQKAGQKPDLAAALDACAAEDSDGDGIANAVELFAGRHPGDPADRPGPAEQADARARLAGWEGARKRTYAWKPFDRVSRPPVPAASAGLAGRAGGNAIDAFIGVRLRSAGVEPRPEAARHVLLRRAYLDLVGIPPTPAEVEAFVNDPAPDAYERVVDRLLASPLHAERWARHWMDVWRYADWAGYGAEVRDSQKHIWHWRDWIVESLDADKGYDRMVQEMLAADELAPADGDALRATGFLVRNWYKFNRNVWLDRTVEHTSKAFLGVTLNCARCHDHFFDPIGQKEYYAFRAVFEPHQVRTDRLPGQPDVDKDGLPRVYDANLAAVTHLFVRGDEASPDRASSIAPGVPAALGGKLNIEPVQLPRAAHQPDRRPFVAAENLAAARAALITAEANAGRERAHVAATAGLLVAGGPARPSATLAAGALAWRAGEMLAAGALQAEAARLRVQATEAVNAVEQLEDAGQPGGTGTKKEATQAAREKAAGLQREQKLAEARFAVRNAAFLHDQAGGKARAAAAKALTAARQQLAALESAKGPPAYTPRPGAAFPATSTGRRLALARWITSRDNPVAARVAVNHVWLRHLGRGLVASEFDLGTNGGVPTHPELLDWLAAEFMESGWSMKHLHRLIVTSNAYRRDSGASPAALARDPDNRLLWRMNSRRAEGEVVRDSLLAIADRLDLARGGPELDHGQGLTVPRRSLYFRNAAEKQMEFLALFDGPSVVECYRRSESISPQQALALANSSLALTMSRLLARELDRDGAKGRADEAFVRAAYARVLNRAPREDELQACREFLTAQSALLADRTRLTPAGGLPGGVAPSPDPRLRAREGLVHVLLNHHEFVTLR